MKVRSLIEAETGRVLLPRVEIANWFWPRLWGLQFRRTLPAGTGMLLTPCASIHTCFVRFRLDVLMLDRELRVVGAARCATVADRLRGARDPGRRGNERRRMPRAAGGYAAGTGLSQRAATAC